MPDNNPDPTNEDTTVTDPVDVTPDDSAGEELLDESQGEESPSDTEPEAPEDDGAEPEKDSDLDSAPTDGEEDFDPYDADKAKAFIGKEIAKRTENLENQLFQTKVNNQIDSIIRENPEYAPYEARIRRFANHPNRVSLIKQGLPVKTVALEAVAPYLQRMGAEKGKQADAEVEKKKTGGDSGSRPTTGGANKYAGMSNSEIERIAEDVKAGRA